MPDDADARTHQLANFSGDGALTEILSPGNAQEGEVAGASAANVVGIERKSQWFARVYANLRRK